MSHTHRSSYMKFDGNYKAYTVRYWQHNSLTSICLKEMYMHAGINNGCSINFINRLWQLEDSRWLLEALFSSLHDGSPYGNWWLPPTPFSKCMHQWAFTKCSFLWGAFTHIATPQHTNWQESISRIHWL